MDEFFSDPILIFNKIDDVSGQGFTVVLRVPENSDVEKIWEFNDCE